MNKLPGSNMTYEEYLTIRYELDMSASLEVCLIIENGKVIIK